MNSCMDVEIDWAQLVQGSLDDIRDFLATNKSQEAFRKIVEYATLHQQRKEILQILQDMKMDLESPIIYPNGAQITPLLLGCMSGDSELVQFMLNELKIGTKRVNIGPNNPLLLSLMWQKFGVAKVLTDHGFLLDKDDFTRVFMLAVSLEISGVLEFLHQHMGFNMTAPLDSFRLARGNTAETRGSFKTRNESNVDILEAFYGGFTPLIYAVSAGKYTAATYLLETCKVNPNEGWIFEGGKLSPLSYACHKNDLKMVDILLQNGADSEFCIDNDLMFCPLVQACVVGNIQMTRMLLEHHIYNSQIEYAGEKAILAKNEEIVRTLTNRNLPQAIVHSWLILATQLKCVKIVNILLNKEVPAISLEISLRVACENQDFSTAQLLIRAGASLNSHDRFWISPLLIATQSKNIQFIRMILEFDDHPDRITWVNDLAECAAKITIPRCLELLELERPDLPVTVDQCTFERNRKLCECIGVALTLYNASELIDQLLVKCREEGNLIVYCLILVGVFRAHTTRFTSGIIEKYLPDLLALISSSKYLSLKTLAIFLHLHPQKSKRENILDIVVNCLSVGQLLPEESLNILQELCNVSLEVLAPHAVNLILFTSRIPFVNNELNQWECSRIFMHFLKSLRKEKLPLVFGSFMQLLSRSTWTHFAECLIYFVCFLEKSHLVPYQQQLLKYAGEIVKYAQEQHTILKNIDLDFIVKVAVSNDLQLRIQKSTNVTELYSFSPPEIQAQVKAVLSLALLDSHGRPLHSNSHFWKLPKDILLYLISLAIYDITENVKKFEPEWAQKLAIPGKVCTYLTLIHHLKEKHPTMEISEPPLKKLRTA